MSQNKAFYTQDQNVFHSSENTRGPWSPEHQHAGPPAALLARAIERSLPTDAPMHISRITYEILRPVPIATLRLETRAIHTGRTLQVIEGRLNNDAGKPLILARAVAVRINEMQLAPIADPFEPPPPPEQSTPFEFDFFSEAVGYQTAMELRHARGKRGGGHIAMWMRMRMPLVAGEAPTPLQRVAIAADSGNGISATLDPMHHTFVNPDLSVYLHRSPVGEWVCLEAQTITQNLGVGLADTRLYDAHGPIGRSDQSLIIQARK